MESTGRYPAVAEADGDATGTAGVATDIMGTSGIEVILNFIIRGGFMPSPS
jgi:hypothetical protein